MSSAQTKNLFDSALTQQILQTVRGIRYGSVEIIVHDGRIVQIERREKLRFEPATVARPRHESGSTGSEN